MRSLPTIITVTTQLPRARFRSISTNSPFPTRIILVVMLAAICVGCAKKTGTREETIRAASQAAAVPLSTATIGVARIDPIRAANAISKFRMLSDANEEPMPTNIQLVEAKVGAAEDVLYGDGTSSREGADAVDVLAIVVAGSGHFSGTAEKLNGTPPSSGTVPSIIVRNDNGEVTDWGIGDAFPSLEKLGIVVMHYQ